MANFNVDITDPQAAGAQALAPVAPVKETGYKEPWLNLAATGLNLFSKYKEEEKLKAENEIVNSFIRKSSAYSEASSSADSITRQQIAVKQRSLYTQYVAQHPGLIAKFSDAQKNLNVGTELAVLAEEEKATKAASAELDKKLISEGYPIYQGMPPDLREQFIGVYQAEVRSEKKFESTEKRDRAARERGSYNREEANYNMKLEAVADLNNIGGQMVPASISYVSDITSKASSPEQVIAAKNQLTSYFSLWEAKIATAARIDPALASNWKGVMKELKDQAFLSLDKGTESAMLKDKLDSLKFKSQLMMLAGSSAVQMAYAADALLGNSAPEMIGKAGMTEVPSEVARLVTLNAQNGGVNGDLGVPAIVGDTNEKQVVQVIKDNINKMDAGTAGSPEKTAPQLKNIVDNYLTQFKRAPGNEIPPAKLSEAVKFFGSSEFTKANKAGLIDPAQAATVKDVMRSYYTKSVMPLVNKELQVPFQGQQSFMDTVELDWQGNQLVVKPINLIMSPDKAAEREAIMIKVKPALTVLSDVIRAGANLEGGTNPKKYWEGTRGEMFPQVYDQSGKPIEVPSNQTRGIQPIKQAVAMEDIKVGTRIGQYVYSGRDPKKYPEDLNIEGNWVIK